MSKFEYVSSDSHQTSLAGEECLMFFFGGGGAGSRTLNKHFYLIY